MTASVQKLIANTLEERIRVSLTAADVLEALQALDANERGVLLDSIRLNNTNAAGRALLGATNALVKARSRAQAQAYLSDGTLTTLEMMEIFG